MDGTDKQTVFAALSYLLSYPDEEWRKERSEWQQIIGEIEHEALKGHLLAFLESAASYSSEELIETYVYTFDFGKKQTFMSPISTPANKGSAVLNCCS